MKDMPASIGWIQTASGGRFSPLSPKPGDINIHDVAASLSKVCRFAGHCSKFYSVAEHSVLVSCILQDRYPERQDLAKWGLLHDASEAYVADISSPLKRQPEFKFYRDMEAKIMHAVCEAFSLDPKEPPEVKEADQYALAIEARDLMPLRELKEWDWLPKISTAYEAIGLYPDSAEQLFLDTFHDLIKGIHD